MKRCSLSTIKSYQRSFSPEDSISNKKPPTQQIVLEGTIGFSLMNICFLMSFSSRKFSFIVFLNQLFKVSIVNLSSTEKSSAMDLDFLRARTAAAASFIW